MGEARAVRSLPSVAEIELRRMFELSDFPDLPAGVTEMEKNFPSQRAAQEK